MRIGVNATCLLQETPADTGNIVKDLLIAVCRLHPEHTFIFFFDKAPSPSLQLPDNVTPVVIPLKGTKNWQQYLWLEWKLVSAINKQQLDIFLGLDGRLPLRSKVPANLLITDMGFMHGVAGMPLSRQRFLQKNMVKYIEQAKKVIVLSHTLKLDVLEYATAARDKLTLLRPAVDKSYQPLAWEDREDVKQTFAGGVEYFIAVGSMHPKNNLMPLLKAFSALKRRLHSNMKLVLVGAETTAGNDIAGSLPSYKFRNDVVWIQDASQETLAQLIAGAYALIYSSRFAGIAMPVYAAMECEVPVIALESAIAREAGEDAVLYTDPDNLEDLADKMCLLYKDEDLRSRLLGKARKAIPGDAPELLIID